MTNKSKNIQGCGYYVPLNNFIALLFFICIDLKKMDENRR